MLNLVYTTVYIFIVLLPGNYLEPDPYSTCLRGIDNPHPLLVVPSKLYFICLYTLSSVYYGYVFYDEPSRVRGGDAIHLLCYTLIWS